MDSMDFQLRLKPVMDVSDIQGNLGTLQQYLNKLKLPDSMKSGFKETFANAEKEVTKIQDILGKKTKTKGDVLGLEKSFGNLDKYINKLSTDMSKLSGKKIFQGIKFETPEIKQTLADIQTLQDKLKEKIDTKAISQANAAIKEMSTVSKSVSLERFKQAFKTGDIATASKELQNLKANLKSFDEKGTTGAKYAEGLEKLENIFKDINVAELKEITNQLKQLDSNLDQLSAEQMDKVNAAFKNGVSSVKTFADETDDAGEKISAATKQQIEFNSQVDQLKNNVKNFFSLTNAVQLFRRALRDAFAQMKELDAVMTETAVVTSFDIGDMWDKLPEYTENANKLGVSIKGMYEASTLYYQQGLKTKEAMELSNETMKMARIAGMEAADATDRMTAALRGFNMELNETSAQRVNDVYSKLAAITASDTDEISNAMTKTASIAASAGMEFETTSAFLAQMIETTREAPENLGTAMKTIVARFTEMKEAPGDIFTDLEGEEVNVNKVDAALRSVGVSLKDSSGQFRDLDDVFIELAERWDSLDVMQQRYIATTAAGSRQQSRFIAMMSNYDRTMELVNAATGSAGASQLQYEKTLDSLETKLTRLKNAWTTFTQTLLDNTLVKAGIDILTLLLEAINKISGALDELADGTGAIASLGAAILAFKGGKSLLNKGLDSILSSFLGKVSVTAEVAGETAALKFQKGVEKGNTATKGTSIFTGAGTAAQGKGVKGGSKAWFSQVGSNISEKWNNARYYGQYDDFLSNQKMVGEEILNARNSGNIEDIQKLGKSYNLSGKELDKFTNAVRNGGPELDKYTNKIAKNKAGIIDQAKASGKSIGQMAAVAAAIVVVTNAIKLVDNAIKTSSEKIAEISTALEETNSKITENQEILDNYQDTKNTYDDMVDSLDELREGTAEWNQNLIKVNSQTQEIISKYPELIKYVKEVNGAQVMSAEGWAAYQDNVTEALQKQYGIQSGLNNQLAQNQLVKNLEGMTYNDNDTIKTTTITSEEQSQIKTGTTIGGVAGGAAGVVGGGVAGAAAAGALAGSVVPGLGNAVGALVGLLVGGIAAAIGAGIGAGIGSIGTGSGVDPRDAIKLGTLAGDEGFVAENATAEQIDTFITKAESAGIALGELEDVIREDGAAFDEWVQTNVQAELQKESQRDALISNTIAQNDKLMNSDVLSYVKDTVDVSFDDYDERFATALEEVEDLGEDQLKTQYGTLMNLTADEIEAKLESKELSEETMQQAIAANNVAEDLASTMEGLITVFEDLKEKASEENSKGNKTENAKIASAVLHAVSGEGKGMTQSDIDLFNEELGGKNGIANLQKQFKEEKISEDDLAKKIDTILDETDASLEELKLSAKDFMQNLTTADNLSKKLVKTYGLNSVNQVNKTLGTDNVLGTSGSGYSIGAQETVTKMFSRGVDGSGADKIIANIFKKLGEQVTEENIDQYNSLLENTEIESGSIESFMDALEDLGFETENFANELKDATNATRELTNEQRQSKVTTSERAYDVLNEKTDTIFTKEEKEILTETKAVDDDDFVVLGDKFIYLGGTVNDLRTAVEKNTKAQLGEDYKNDKNIVDIKNKKEAADKAIAKIPTGLVNYSPPVNPFNTNQKSSPLELTLPGDIKKEGTLTLSPFSENPNTNTETGFSEYSVKAQQAAIQAIKEFLLATGKYTEDMLKNMNDDELKSKYDALTDDKTGAYSSEKIKATKKEQDASYFATQAYSDHISLMGNISKEVSLGDKADQDYINNMTEGLEVYAKTLGISNKTLDTYITKLQDTDEGVRAVAAAELDAQLKAAKTKQAIKNNADALKEYNTQLENSPKDSEEYSKALDGIANSMNDIMDTDVDYNFFEDKDNLDLYKDAVNGVEGAWEELKKKMQAESIGNSDFLANSLGLSSESVNAILNKTDSIKTAFNNLSYDATGKVNLTPLYNALTIAGLKAKEATKFLKGMGFSYTITTEKKPLTGAGFISPWSTDAGEIELITGYTLNDDGGGDFSANVGDGPSGGGGGGKSSKSQKNTKKAWHYNRDVKTEKRQNKIADIEHKISIEQTKQIPNLKILNKLHKQKLDLLEEEKTQQKANYNAAIKEENRLWKQGKKKGYNKLLNKDGTVNLKAYNSKKWKNEKEKERFDEWESKLEDTREYKQSSKEAKQDAGLQIKELKNARSEYTKLTNLSATYEARQSKINNLQTKYNILLNDANVSAGKLAGNLSEQLNLLKQQQKQQELIKSTATSQAKSYKKESGISTYIKKTDFSTGEVLVDYTKLNKDIKKGLINKEDADNAISKYKDMISEAATANDELINIEGQISDMKKAALEDVVNTQSEIRSAIIQARQDTIDNLSNIDSSINDTNSKILSAVQDNISQMRQDRKNQQTEENLAEKETRLAYLRQNSGGGNAVEIAKLEDEIAKGQEDYTDTLIDQKISELQDQNNKASEQRQRQIKILEKQFSVDQKNGEITREVADWWENGDWIALLKDYYNYGNMTKPEQLKEDQNFAGKASNKVLTDFSSGGRIKTAQGNVIKKGGKLGKGTVSNMKLNNDGTVSVISEENKKGMHVTTTTKMSINDQGQVDEKGKRVSKTATLDTHTNKKGKKTGGQKVGDFISLKDNVYKKALAQNKAVYGYNGNKNVFKIASINPSSGDVKLYTSPEEDKNRTLTVSAKDIKAQNLKGDYKKLKYVENNNDMLYKFTDGIQLQKKRGDGKYQDVTNKKEWKGRYFKLINNQKTGGKVFRRVDKDGKQSSSDKKNNIRFKTKNDKPKNIKQFKTGGLADFTGPAWLDGTKTKPEIILNQKDTENFIQLKNILADAMRNTSSISNQTNGDLNCEVHINVEKMTSDYDVDQVAKRVKKILNDDGRYRIVNQINRLR